MRKIITFFAKWWSAGRSLKQVANAQRSLMSIEVKRSKVLRQINARGAELNAISEALAADLEEAKQVQKQFAEELEATKSKLQVAEEHTIPALVQAHELLLARLDADTSIEITRRVGVMSASHAE